AEEAGLGFAGEEDLLVVAVTGGECVVAAGAEAGDAAGLDLKEVAGDAVNAEGIPDAADDFLAGGAAMGAEDPGVLDEVIGIGDVAGEAHGARGASWPG